MHAAILIAVSVVVVLDLRIRPVGTNTMVIPPIYKELKQPPDGLVVEYPIEAAGHGDYSAEFFQDFHGKPILNGFDSETLSEFRALRLDKLSRPVTPGRLSMVGVRYVVVTHVPIEGGVTRPGSPGKGLHLIMPGKYASLYSVQAKPLPLVTLGPGFSLPEQTPTGIIQWLSSDEGEIELRAPCSPCVGTLNVVATSFAQPRSVTLRGPDGRTLAVRRVGVRPQSISFPVRFDRRALVKVTTSPAPQPAGRADTRSLSVSMGGSGSGCEAQLAERPLEQRPPVEAPCVVECGPAPLLPALAIAEGALDRIGKRAGFEGDQLRSACCSSSCALWGRSVITIGSPAREIGLQLRGIGVLGEDVVGRVVGRDRHAAAGKERLHAALIVDEPGEAEATVEAGARGMIAQTSCSSGPEPAISATKSTPRLASRSRASTSSPTPCRLIRCPTYRTRRALQPSSAVTGTRSTHAPMGTTWERADCSGRRPRRSLRPRSAASDSSKRASAERQQRASKRS